MPVRLSTRQLAEPAATLKSISSPPSVISTTLCLRPHPNLVSRRSIKSTASNYQQGNEAAPRASANPYLEAYLKKKPSIQRADRAPQRGGLAPSSIFERRKPREESPQEEESKSTMPAETTEKSKPIRDRNAMAAVLDPEPERRARWTRRKVIQLIRTRGRISRAAMLKRTERESLAKSHLFKTSVKKLNPLARQIAGKPIEEAITQMRFSKKKVAQDVKEHLEHARNEAIVARGMGLGQVEGTKGEPVEIQLKDGKRKLVEDRTGIYVDQAYVGRGPYGFGLDYRARGRLHRLYLPSTSLSVILKEEKTRIRQHEERVEKRRNRKLWVQLPDRPITAQTPYYCW
ncbi:MAG: 54S ribosomal protein L22, mitochondrial [Bogoriella megaspora]|nr:MAG: 54S ribosomal protein L22, mitochondrial [Bogoriella megaspora]